MRREQDWAHFYLHRGFSPIPVPSGLKSPIIRGWPDLRLDHPDVEESFPSPTNMGLLLGSASGGLVDVDIDDDGALALAPKVLPSTGMKHGRRCRPSSHWWYRVIGPAASHRFVAPDGRVLVEVRGERLQTVVPPSVHPSRDTYVWEALDEPTVIGHGELYERAAILAAGALLRPLAGRAGSVASSSLARWIFSLDMSHSFKRILVEHLGIEVDPSVPPAPPPPHDAVMNVVEGWLAGVDGLTRRQQFVHQPDIRTPEPISADGDRPIHVVLRRLTEAGCSPRVCGEGYKAHCPCHDDERPSLSVAETSDGVVLLRCHAVGDAERVVDALGLRMADLYPKERRRRRRSRR